MTRRTERLLVEVAYDDVTEDPPSTWGWGFGVELEPRQVKVLAVVTPEAARAITEDQDAVPDPYGNRPRGTAGLRDLDFGGETDAEARSERRLWESGL